jgi:hypothetical protein
MSRKMKHFLGGKRFGKLLVTETHENQKHPYISRKTGKQVDYSTQYWLCKCDCGNDYWAKTSYLLLGKVVSCGCYWENTYKLPEGQAAKNEIFQSYKRGARNRNLPFTLSIEDFINVVQRDCFYCGSPPSIIAGRYGNNGTFIHNGIDRIDNTKGYEKENIVPCCSLCNRMKSD